MSDMHTSAGVPRAQPRAAIEIICSCGHCSVAGTVESVCRAHVCHAYSVHGRTVSLTEARALARSSGPSEGSREGDRGGATGRKATM